MRRGITRTRRTARSWLALVLGVAGVAMFVLLLQEISPALPGPAGAVYCHNVNAKTETSALIYTETGDVRDYLDTVRGKYGSVRMDDR